MSCSQCSQQSWRTVIPAPEVEGGPFQAACRLLRLRLAQLHADRAPARHPRRVQIGPAPRERARHQAAGRAGVLDQRQQQRDGLLVSAIARPRIDWTRITDRISRVPSSAHAAWRRASAWCADCGPACVRSAIWLAAAEPAAPRGRCRPTCPGTSASTPRGRDGACRREPQPLPFSHTRARPLSDLHPAARNSTPRNGGSANCRSGRKHHIELLTAAAVSSQPSGQRSHSRGVD